MRGEGRGARGEGRGARGEGRGARGEGRGARGEGRGASGDGLGARGERGGDIELIVAFNLSEAVSAPASSGRIMAELLIMPYCYMRGEGRGARGDGRVARGEG